jgi:hypothetical protein
MYFFYFSLALKIIFIPAVQVGKDWFYQAGCISEPSALIEEKRVRGR